MLIAYCMLVLVAEWMPTHMSLVMNWIDKSATIYEIYKSDSVAALQLSWYVQVIDWFCAKLGTDNDPVFPINGK